MISCAVKREFAICVTHRMEDNSACRRHHVGVRPANKCGSEAKLLAQSLSAAGVQCSYSQYSVHVVRRVLRIRACQAFLPVGWLEHEMQKPVNSDSTGFCVFGWLLRAG
jgi:hypothetical protein